MQINKLIPDTTQGLSRKSMVNLAEMVYFLSQKPIMKEIYREFGEKDMKSAFNELETIAQLYR